MSDTRVRTVLVVGATGRIGRLVVAAALRHGLDVRALVRDTKRAAGVLPGATLVPGELTRAADLTAAVAGVDAVILTHGSAGYGARDLEDVDYGAVANLLTALDGRRVRVALMTSINVNERSGAYQDVLDWKRRGERLLRASGLPALADDSGLEVDALGGQPGLHSHRFGPGMAASDAERRAYLLSRLAGLPRPWTAHFHCTVAVALPGGEVRLADGDCPGEILPEERGAGGFGSSGLK